MKLFSTYDLRITLEEIIKNICDEIQSKDKNYLLNVNEEEYFNYLYVKYKVEGITLFDDKIYGTTSEKKIKSEVFPRDFYVVSGSKYNKPIIQYHIPFMGEEKWLKSRASRYLMWSPEADINNNEIILEYIIFSDSYVESIKRDYTHEIANFKTQIEYINKDIDVFKSTFNDVIKSIFKKRKDEILKTNQLLQMFDVPIKKNENVSETFAIPTIGQRKQIICEPMFDKGSIVKNAPEGKLDDTTYHQILKVIDDMGKEFERLPSLYKDKDEETLRDHLLMLLQPNFNGSATGETFNKKGKTDILLRYENNNVFVGECKFWKGKSVYLDTISQLLSYLTWRDSKVAVIIFVRQKNIIDVLKKIDEYTPKHSNFLSKKNNTHEALFNYIFHLNGDKEREVKVAIMVYHLCE